MKNTIILYTKLIALKVLQLLKKVAIVLLTMQGIYTAGYAVHNYATTQVVPNILEVVLLITYLVLIIVLKSCKGILISCIAETGSEIDHNQKLRLHKRELLQKSEYGLVEKQVKIEVMEAESDMAAPRKFNMQKVSKDATVELNKLVGLASVKEELQRMHAVTQYEKKHGGLKNQTVYHMRFVGNPGCGKTTVAKCMASILYNAGIIQKPKLITVNGNELMGEYVGTTAPTVRALFKQAAGGLLFIDEAYALTSGPRSQSTSYGYEAVNELLTQLEDKKNNVTVIFAGYEALLNQFFAMNPGLASRVPKTLMFPDYEPNELLDILAMRLKEFGHKLDETTKENLLQLFAQKISYCRLHRAPFSNGRYSRNVADAIHAQHALNYEKNSSVGTVITMQDIDFISLLALD